ncbi:MAG: hypothetical protein K8R60_07650 [Burkholderiales bacterium]|nr:hypothetical protein [Burkholderiales bacterium]
MDESQLASALQAEYFHLQKTIEDFDGKAMTIKAWSVTFSFSVIVGAFASHAPAVLLVAATSSLLFWFLETMWKAFQLGYYERASQIEAHFRGDAELKSAHQIGASWMTRWRRTSWPEIGRMALWPHVALPHAVVVLVGAGLFAAALLGGLKL